MGLPLRRAVLNRLTSALLILPPALLCGCGLLIDAVQWIQPIAKDEVHTICLRKRVQIGMSVEPVRPFVFPAIFTDEGVRITGLDVELTRELVSVLTKECGGEPIEPVLHLVRFRDLFVLLSEGKLDFFVSSITANVPSPERSGLAYSSPYVTDGGLGVMTHEATLNRRIAEQLGSPPGTADRLRVIQAFAGLTVAVQKGTTAELYARGYLKDSRVMVCDSLPAAFEWQDPPVDVLIGKLPVFKFMSVTARKDWQLLTTLDGRPVRLTREQYAVVTAEESYRLQTLIDHTLFQLEETGRLAEIRRRWFEEPYAYPRRAAAEGLPFAAADMPAHYDQGTCRPDSAH